MIEDRQQRIADSAERNRQFVAKWQHRLVGPPKAHDGFIYHDRWASDGNGSYIDIEDIPKDWFDVLDTYLEGVKLWCPEFRISQLKLKFGTVYLYLRGVPVEAQREADQLSQRLTDKRLVF